MAWSKYITESWRCARNAPIFIPQTCRLTFSIEPFRTRTRAFGAGNLTYSFQNSVVRSNWNNFLDVFEEPSGICDFNVQMIAWLEIDFSAWPGTSIQTNYILHSSGSWSFGNIHKRCKLIELNKTILFNRTTHSRNALLGLFTITKNASPSRKKPKNLSLYLFNPVPVSRKSLMHLTFFTPSNKENTLFSK